MSRIFAEVLHERQLFWRRILLFRRLSVTKAQLGELTTQQKIKSKREDQFLVILRITRLKIYQEGPASNFCNLIKADRMGAQKIYSVQKWTIFNFASDHSLSRRCQCRRTVHVIESVRSGKEQFQWTLS